MSQSHKVEFKHSYTPRKIVSTFLSIIAKYRTSIVSACTYSFLHGDYLSLANPYQCSFHRLVPQETNHLPLSLSPQYVSNPHPHSQPKQSNHHTAAVKLLRDLTILFPLLSFPFLSTFASNQITCFSALLFLSSTTSCRSSRPIQFLHPPPFP